MSTLDQLQAQIDAAQARYDDAMFWVWVLLAFEVARVGGLFAHELGHVVMARRAGMPVRMIRLGTGRPILRLRFGRTWLVFRLFPRSGGVLALEPGQLSLADATGFLLGGIYANSLLLLAAAVAALLQKESWWWSLPLGLAQITLIVSSLRRTPNRRKRTGYRSDGDRLRSLRRGEPLWLPEKTQAELAAHLTVPGPFPVPSPTWPEIAYQLTRPERTNEVWSRRDSVAVLRPILGDVTLTDFERLLIRDNLVIREAIHEDGILTAAELDAWSAAALAAAPTTPVRIARAGALCRLGRHAEAAALLDPANDAASPRKAAARLFTLRVNAAAKIAGPPP